MPSILAKAASSIALSSLVLAITSASAHAAPAEQPLLVGFARMPAATTCY